MRFGRSMALMGLASLGLIGAGSIVNITAQPERAVMPSEARVRKPANHHKRRSGWLYDRNGKRERERRIRQIERGQLGASYFNGAGASLRVENGLVR